MVMTGFRKQFNNTVNAGISMPSRTSQDLYSFNLAEVVAMALKEKSAPNFTGLFGSAQNAVDRVVMECDPSSRQEEELVKAAALLTIAPSQFSGDTVKKVYGEGISQSALHSLVLRTAVMNGAFRSYMHQTGTDVADTVTRLAIAGTTDAIPFKGLAYDWSIDPKQDAHDDAYFDRVHSDGSIADVLALRPDFGMPFMKATQLAMRQQRGKPIYIDRHTSDILQDGARELIAAAVSHYNACEFCADSHSHIVEELGTGYSTVGYSQSDIGILFEHGVEHTSFADKPLGMLVKYARELTKRPFAESTTDAFTDAFAEGVSPDALFETQNIVTMFNIANRIVEGHGIRGTENGKKSDAAVLAKVGYSALAVPYLAKTRIANFFRG